MKDEFGPKSSPAEMKYWDLDPADKRLVEKALSKGYTRREVFKLMMATGVTMAAADSLLLSGRDALAATPKKGGSVRMAAPLHGPDDQLDPALFTSTIDYTRGRATYNSLTQLADDLSPMPDLAEEFLPNANATEWTFKLRKGVTWHDGKPFTADDVVWSMNRHIGEKSTSVVKAVLTSVSEWKKVNQHEVKAVLNTPNADLPIVLGIFQTKITQADTKVHKGIGTGPFVLKSFEPGVKSVHKRNENYFRDGPNLDALEIFGITDPVARVNALISGDVQLAAVIEPKAIRQVEGANNVTLTSIPAGLYMGICCLKNAKPGESDDFVKGLQYIQDRKRIVKRILKGHGSVGNDQPIMSAYGKDWCSELPQREYDPDKAKHHFKKSGYSTAELFVAPVTAGIEDAMLLCQANCLKIGFDLKLKRVPTDGYWGAVWMNEPLNVVTWNMRPTANSMLAIQFAPGAAWNDTYWNNERFGELLKLSLAELDPDKRHAMYCEMQTLVHNGSGMVIPAHANILDGVANNVKGVPKVPLGQLGACEWPEFAWLA